MKIRLCCKQSEIKPAFSFYCRWCYICLQQRYGIDVNDYKFYFKTMYNIQVHVDDCEYKHMKFIITL